MVTQLPVFRSFGILCLSIMFQWIDAFTNFHFNNTHAQKIAMIDLIYISLAMFFNFSMSILCLVSPTLIKEWVMELPQGRDLETKLLPHYFVFFELN